MNTEVTFSDLKKQYGSYQKTQTWLRRFTFANICLICGAVAVAVSYPSLQNILALTMLSAILLFLVRRTRKDFEQRAKDQLSEFMQKLKCYKSDGGSSIAQDDIAKCYQQTVSGSGDSILLHRLIGMFFAIESMAISMNSNK